MTSRRAPDPLDELTDAIAAFTGHALPREARERFARYLELLVQWNRTHDLVGLDKPFDIVRVLFIDSLFFLPLLPERPIRLVDIGAGAGIPGLPLHLVDPAIELTNGGRLWELDVATHTWVEDAAFGAAAGAPGWTAVADFDPSDGKARPEIVSVHDGVVEVMELDHSVFHGMNAVPVPGGGGGPPTVADYDGDGLPEIGIAGQSFYTLGKSLYYPYQNLLDSLMAWIQRPL